MFAAKKHSCKRATRNVVHL